MIYYFLNECGELDNRVLQENTILPCFFFFFLCDNMACGVSLSYFGLILRFQCYFSLFSLTSTLITRKKYMVLANVITTNMISHYILYFFNIKNLVFIWVFIGLILHHFPLTYAGSNKMGSVSAISSPNNGTVEVGPGPLKMTFSSASGQLTRIFNSISGVSPNTYCHLSIYVCVCKVRLDKQLF
jgi:hypothetical protein